MAKRRFTEEQIMQILQEQADGMATAVLCTKYNISAATFYGWKTRYSGLSLEKTKRMKQLQQENEKLKRLLSEALLKNAVMTSGKL